MEDVNRQHMAHLGLDPEQLGQPTAGTRVDRDIDRCDGVNPETGSRCAMASGHHYDEHIRGHEHWPVTLGPTRAPGRREGDQVLPTGDLDVVDDQELIAKTLHQLADDLMERRKLGITRYGQGHRPFNGRNTIQDAYDEGVDQTVYLGSLLRARAAQREDLIPVVERIIGDRGVAAEIVDRVLDYVTVKIEEGKS